MISQRQKNVMVEVKNSKIFDTVMYITVHDVHKYPEYLCSFEFMILENIQPTGFNYLKTCQWALLVRIDILFKYSV